MNVKIKRNQSEYHPKLGIVISNYSGHFLSPSFQTICLKAITLLEAHQASCILVDNSQLHMLSIENRVWIQKTWFPKALKAGLRRIAFVMPDNIFGRVATVNANRYATDKRLQIRYFTNQKEALFWLLA